jgi:hypothetical protein
METVPHQNIDQHYQKLQYSTIPTKSIHSTVSELLGLRDKQNTVSGMEKPCLF